VPAVGDQLTKYRRLAEREFEQTRDPFAAPAAGRRHAIECVCHLTQPALKSNPDLLIPGRAMAAAARNPEHR
jgi:hypothetical protein